jgi:hypothetical protein
MTNEERIEILKSRRSVAWIHLKHTTMILVRARGVYETIAKRRDTDKLEYETIDRELAMLDGRFKIEEPASSKSKLRLAKTESEPELDLTPEMIERLAKSLGIILPSVPEDLGIPDEIETLELGDGN